MLRLWGYSASAGHVQQTDVDRLDKTHRAADVKTKSRPETLAECAAAFVKRWKGPSVAPGDVFLRAGWIAGYRAAVRDHRPKRRQKVTLI